MKRVISVILLIVLTASTVGAATGLRFPATRLGHNSLTGLAADAMMLVDGVPLGRLAATTITEEGSLVTCWWEPYADWEEFPDPPVVQLTDIRLYMICPDGGTQVVRPGVWFVIPVEPGLVVNLPGRGPMFRPCMEGPGSSDSDQLSGVNPPAVPWQRHLALGN
jgi:hypothetical protein